MLSTVEQPEKRCSLCVRKDKKQRIKLEAVCQNKNVDFMSPLFSLDSDDAMGRYDEPSDCYGVSTYGSAIVEFRSIQYVINHNNKINGHYIPIRYFCIFDCGR